MRRTLLTLLAAAAVFCGPADAASRMEEFARTLHDTEFSVQVEQLLTKNQSAQALELAEIGIKRNPLNVQLRFMRSVALENLGRREEAARALESLTSEFPEIPEPYNNLAVIEAGMGNLEKAHALLKRALTINPDFTLARKNLGDVYLALAIENYEAAAEKLTKNTELQSRLRTLHRMTRSGV